MILEIQQKVLSFLVQCCKLILADLPPETLTDKSVAIEPDPGPVITDPEAWPTLAGLRTEAPYRVPARLDFSRLQAMIAAKYSAVKDHIWILRENPGYFNSIVQKFSTHRLETLLDVNGEQHPNLGSTQFWDFVLDSIVDVAYVELVT